MGNEVAACPDSFNIRFFSPGMNHDMIVFIDLHT
jgi:hypothetical protein